MDQNNLLILFHIVHSSKNKTLQTQKADMNIFIYKDLLNFMSKV